MDPSTTIQAFDAFLARRTLTLDAVIVGGTALGLLGIVSRPTRDCDVLHPPIPRAVRQAAEDFAAECRRAGEVLADDWLNDGPSSLVRDLPVGWEDRLRIAYRGKAVTLRTLGRLDLLRPTEAELEELRPWLEERDANPDWPAHARETLADLTRRLRHGL